MEDVRWKMQDGLDAYGEAMNFISLCCLSVYLFHLLQWGCLWQIIPFPSISLPFTFTMSTLYLHLAYDKGVTLGILMVISGNSNRLSVSQWHLRVSYKTLKTNHLFNTFCCDLTACPTSAFRISFALAKRELTMVSTR